MTAVKPSQKKLDRRKIVGLNAETVTNITSNDFPGHFPGEDHIWSIDKFERGLKVKFYKNDPLEASFSLIGIDASFANAFRRILLAEVPTIAIEKVFIRNNTSLIADEVLAQRLGLIPLKGNIEGLHWLRWHQDSDPENGIEGTGDLDNNIIHLKLEIECTRNTRAENEEKDPKKKYHNAHVYAKDLVFVPHERQAEKFGNEPIVPVNPDILIAKLRPGQELDLDMYCVRGRGCDHAKFSPVATATYRLLPTIDILKPILGDDATEFAKCFPPGVIDVARVTPADAMKAGSGYEGQEGEPKAVVKDAFSDTVSRECLRHDKFKDKVKLGRVRDHFIFNVESTGQENSDTLFLASVELLKLKAIQLKRALEKIK